jgi:hypothetical protein
MTSSNTTTNNLKPILECQVCKGRGSFKYRQLACDVDCQCKTCITYRNEDSKVAQGKKRLLGYPVSTYNSKDVKKIYVSAQEAKKFEPKPLKKINATQNIRDFLINIHTLEQGLTLKQIIYKAYEEQTPLAERTIFYEGEDPSISWNEMENTRTALRRLQKYDPNFKRLMSVPYKFIDNKGRLKTEYKWVNIPEDNEELLHKGIAYHNKLANDVMAGLDKSVNWDKLRFKHWKFIESQPMQFQIEYNYYMQSARYVEEKSSGRVSRYVDNREQKRKQYLPTKAELVNTIWQLKKQKKIPYKYKANYSGIAHVLKETLVKMVMSDAMQEDTKINKLLTLEDVPPFMSCRIAANKIRQELIPKILEDIILCDVQKRNYKSPIPEPQYWTRVQEYDKKFMQEWNEIKAGKKPYPQPQEAYSEIKQRCVDLWKLLTDNNRFATVDDDIILDLIKPTRQYRVDLAFNMSNHNERTHRYNDLHYLQDIIIDMTNLLEDTELIKTEICKVKIYEKEKKLNTIQVTPKNKYNIDKMHIDSAIWNVWRTLTNNIPFPPETRDVYVECVLATRPYRKYLIDNLLVEQRTSLYNHLTFIDILADDMKKILDTVGVND